MKKITLIIAIFCVGFINAQEVNYTVKNLDVNTKYQDYGTSFFGESNVIISSTRKGKSIRRNSVWNENKQPYLALFEGVINEVGEITGIELFSKKLNSKYHDADIIFTKDLKTAYFTRNNYLNKKYKKDTLGRNLNQLYKAEIDEEGKWTNLQSMPFNNDNYQTGHPSLNKEENKLYFISDMPGSYGKTDIYVVDILRNGTYSSPKNLGPNVNTIEREMFPFIDEFDILYFSSDGYVDGFGELDIYACRINNGEPDKVENIGIPMNSTNDDFGLVFKKGMDTGYFSSNRQGGKGDDDIYSFEAFNRIKNECKQMVEGVVVDKNSGINISGAMVVLFDKNNNELDKTIVSENAFYSFEIDCDKAYKVKASKKGYSSILKDFESVKGSDLEFKLPISMEDFELKGDKLVVSIDPIYFDLDKSFVRPDAEIELEKVLKVMIKYPKIKVALGSHTDSRGSDKYNLNLSNRRAKSSLEWLFDNGIDPTRITGEGYGETKLVNKCSNGVPCTKDEHQLNRRTEFVILNPEVIN